MLCCAEFACASAEMPDWFRIENSERLVTCCGMFAAVIWSWAAVRFCTCELITFTADCNRLMPAPIVPRKPATFEIALLMSFSAVVAVPDEDRSSLERLTVVPL